MSRFVGKLFKVLSFPFEWIRDRLFAKHDTVLEKKIRREIEITLSHELKTPLTSILAYSELLLESFEKKQVIEKEDKDAIRLIYRKSKELVRYIDNLINISILELNPQIFYSTWVNLSNITVEAINKFIGFYEPDNHLKIITDVQPDLMIYGNERLIKSAIFELLSNCYIYSKEGYDLQIEVQVSMQNGDATIRIRDNGIGIKSQNLNRVFNKFFRVESAETAHTSGMGIGLSLVQKTVNLFGGNITLDSEYGKGLTATLTFPAVTSQQMRD